MSGTTSGEQAVKAQFAKIFKQSDWPLFRKMAEVNLREAAYLLTSDMAMEASLKLLARNSRKRLLIGIGGELLLKAVYLKYGYLINRVAKGGRLKFPFSESDANLSQLLPGETVTFGALIDKLPKVVALANPEVVLRGLQIAKVFRNKEGHVVTGVHQFDPSNYEDIAFGLMELFRDAFAVKMKIKFALEPNDAAMWDIAT